jgi:isochorismate synthase
MTIEAAVGARTLGDVLEQFEPGASFLLTAPRLATLATGEDRTSTVDPVDAAAEAARLLAEDRTRVVVGALPFDDVTPARLTVPRTVTWTSRPAPSIRVVPEQRRDAEWHVRPIPEPGVFVRGVQAAMPLLRSGELRRVVLSRGLELRTPIPVSVGGMLRHLLEHDPVSYTVAAGLPGGQTLICLTPELVLTKRGTQVVLRCLSGTRPRSSDSDTDDRLAEDLLWCDFSRSEHAQVVSETAEALRRMTETVEMPPGPGVAGTSGGWRLVTELRGRPRDPGLSVLDLVAALRPSPAVCGTPADLAREVVNEVEPCVRGYHTGTIGWCDSAGDGEWVTATRCAIVDPIKMRLFTTTNVVAESSPVGVLAEASAEFRSMLLALGINQVP